MMIYFISTENCGSCRKLDGALHCADLSHLVNHKVIDVSVKEDMDFIKKYKIYTFPTLLKIEDDKEVGRLSGLVPLGKVKDFLGVK